MKLSEFPLEKQLHTVHDWIKSADQKISVAFALINGVLVAISIPLAKLIFANLSLLSHPPLFILLAEFVTLYIMSEIFVLRALIPKVSSDYSKNSLLFFGSVASLKPTEYRKKIEKLSKKQLEDDFVSQITTSSEIALKKHVRLTASLVTFSLSILFMSVFLVILLTQIYS